MGDGEYPAVVAEAVDVEAVYEAVGGGAVWVDPAGGTIEVLTGGIEVCTNCCSGCSICGDVPVCDVVAGGVNLPPANCVASCLTLLAIPSINSLIQGGRAAVIAVAVGGGWWG